MKKSLTLLLAVMMLLTSFAFTVNAQDASPIVFNLVEADGSVPFATGRNGECCFPKGTSTINPELYFWGSATAKAVDGYIEINSTKGNSILEFDTFPTDKMWKADNKHAFIVMNIKTGAALGGTGFTLYAQGQKFKKTFSADFTGEWQQIIIDLNDPTGWYNKDNTVYGNSPMKDADGKQVMAGGFRIDMPVSLLGGVTFDYIGLFASAEQAKAYSGRQAPKSVAVIDGKVETTSTENNNNSSSSDEEQVKPEEKEEAPAEPGKPKMKDALKRGEEPVDNSITLVSAVPSTIIDENKLVYKYSRIGAYEEETKKFPVLDDEGTSYLQTWGQGTFENTSAGVLKYIAAASGGTLFESHPKKAPTPAKHKYMLLGYKTNEDFSDKLNTAYLYSSGNVYRLPFNISIDGKWHYDLFDLSKLDAYLKDSNYSEKAEDRANLSFGAFRIDFPKMVGVEYYIDYIGFFADEAEAQEFVKKSREAAALDKGKTPGAEEKFTYMKGYDDGTFRPGAQMTRAEAATVIARLLAEEEEIAKDRETAFTDVKNGDWYYCYVTYLEELGYLPNYNGEFKPNQNITRGEFIKLTFEAGGLDFSMKRPNFTDLEKNHPYYKEIVFASGTGIVTGYDSGDGTMSFKPDGEITRAEIATVVNRILKIEATPDAAQDFSDLAKEHWAFGTIMAIASKK